MTQGNDDKLHHLVADQRQDFTRKAQSYAGKDKNTFFFTKKKVSKKMKDEEEEISVVKKRTIRKKESIEYNHR